VDRAPTVADDAAGGTPAGDVQTTIRFPKPDGPTLLANIDARARAQARTRSDTIRLMLTYADKHMPKGWTP
jgi:hypothetical protein